jgi:hypothetical protein
MNIANQNDEVKKPTWVNVMGVLAIIFGLMGVMGVMGGVQEILMPQMLDAQKEFLGEMKAELKPKVENELIVETLEKKETNDIDPSFIFNQFESMLSFPDWFKKWAPIIGGVSMIAGILYLLGGVFLLMVKSFAPNFFLIACGFSIFWEVVSTLIYSNLGGLMFLGQLPGAIVSILIDAVLMTVLLTSNQRIFKDG